MLSDRRIAVERIGRWPIFSVLSCLALLLGLSGCGRQGPNSAALRQDSASMQHTAGLNTPEDSAPEVAFNTEAYDHIIENDFVDALTQPQSTFSIDVDTASYTNVRRMIQARSLPPAGAVRLEEMINYFRYQYPQPEGEHPFSVNAELAACPWNPKHELLRVGLQGRSIEFHQRQPCNLVFLLDVSGSMLAPNKLPLVQSAMKLLVQELGAQDRVAIVVYAGASGLVLDSTPVEHSQEILAALERLSAGGTTNGGEGIRLAYQVARENFIQGGINRVLLCTDGDFNVGTTNQSELIELIQEKAASNVFLSVLGFGSGNLKDSTMEKLADLGNGNYSYIDSMLEARKVLVEEIGATLVTIAKDVKIQLDFNPQHVQSYRLLGYENRLMDNQDFRDDAKDAGEIGAGHAVTAFYELVPVGAGSESMETRTSEFVTQRIDEQADASTKLTVNLRYKNPEESTSQEFQLRLPAGMFTSHPDADFQFATAVMGYGMLLRGSQYAGQLNWDWVVETATSSLGKDQRGLRGEFVQLAKTARRLSQPGL
ncbi:MAG: VWA domain-containing protein [bacterium]|nr:VWA domain-containing protein [bacterium]